MPAETGHDKLRIGVSTCLLGVNVRYDGGHKQDAYLQGTLDDFFTWVPVCPEVEVGMSTPRDPLRLEGDPASPRMVVIRTSTDWTTRMRHYARERVRALQHEDLHGYILKSRSPSCGMERVKVFPPRGRTVHTGVGLFARELLNRMPCLPVEEEGRLHEPHRRENFIVRVFSHWRWQQLLEAGFSLSALEHFHARHKFLIMAHSATHMRELGRLVAQGRAHTPARLRDAYAALFFQALQHRATRRRHTHVLQHLAGFFKNEISPPDRDELQETIGDYHAGLRPLIVPLTLVLHHARKLELDTIRDQVYLSPHPRELQLLNHV